MGTRFCDSSFSIAERELLRSIVFARLAFRAKFFSGKVIITVFPSKELSERETVLWLKIAGKIITYIYARRNSRVVILDNRFIR